MEEKSVGLPILYAALAAIVGGIVWGLVFAVTNYEIGIIALGIGALAGYAVVFNNHRKISMVHQLIAVVASLIGILLGKYLMFAYFWGGTFSYVFYIDTMEMFAIYFTDLFSLMDIIFILLAVSTAYQIPLRFAQASDNANYEELHSTTQEDVTEEFASTEEINHANDDYR